MFNIGPDKLLTKIATEKCNKFWRQNGKEAVKYKR